MMMLFRGEEDVFFVISSPSYVKFEGGYLDCWRIPSLKRASVDKWQVLKIFENEVSFQNGLNGVTFNFHRPQGSLPHPCKVLAGRLMEDGRSIYIYISFLKETTVS